MGRKVSAHEELFREICRGVGFVLLATVTAPMTVSHARAVSLRRRALAPDNKKRFALRTLRQKKFIEVRKTRTDEKIFLTRKGIAHALITCVEYHPKPLPKGWACIVVFDIPETRRGLRRGIRELLKRLKFTQIQKSTWLAHHDAAAHLRYYAKLQGISRWVRIFTATENERAQK